MAVNSTASSELQVELLPRLSRNLSLCCEKWLSAPGVGFSNFETNYLFFSSISRTKCLRMWSCWCDKWFCSFKNLSRVLPNLRSNAKVSFDGGGGATDQCGPPACAEKWLQTDSAITSAVLLGLVFRCQWGKYEGFGKYFLRLRSNGKEKRVIFLNFRQPPNTLHIHSSDRERTWPEAHCHVCDCQAFSTMPAYVIVKIEENLLPELWVLASFHASLPVWLKPFVTATWPLSIIETEELFAVVASYQETYFIKLSALTMNWWLIIACSHHSELLPNCHPGSSLFWYWCNLLKVSG